MPISAVGTKSNKHGHPNRRRDNVSRPSRVSGLPLLGKAAGKSVQPLQEWRGEKSRIWRPLLFRISLETLQFSRVSRAGNKTGNHFYHRLLTIPLQE